MSRKRAKLNRKAVLCLAAAVVLLLVGVLFLHLWEEDHSRVPQGGTGPEDELTYFDGAWYRPRKDVEAVLLMGIDKAALDETLPVQGEYEQSDFLLLLVIDRKSMTCTGIHINRDTMTEIQILTDSGRVEGTFTGQITLAHSYGGSPEIRCRNAVTAVSKLMYGIKIDRYISIAMDGIPVLNDLVGGVTVEVMDDLTGIDSTLIQGKTVTLEGQQALTYVRARHGLADPTNTHRMERQKQYLDALQKKLLKFGELDEGFALSTVMELNDYLVSNCSVEQMSDLADTLEECGEVQYRTLEGEAVLEDVYYEFHVDEDALQKTVMELFYEQAEKN